MPIIGVSKGLGFDGGVVTSSFEVVITSSAEVMMILKIGLL